MSNISLQEDLTCEAKKETKAIKEKQFKKDITDYMNYFYHLDEEPWEGEEKFIVSIRKLNRKEQGNE